MFKNKVLCKELTLSLTGLTLTIFDVKHEMFWLMLKPSSVEKVSVVTLELNKQQYITSAC